MLMGENDRIIVRADVLLADAPPPGMRVRLMVYDNGNPTMTDLSFVTTPADRMISLNGVLSGFNMHNFIQARLVFSDAVGLVPISGFYITSFAVPGQNWP
jgi:hypothetical protein